MAARFSQEVCLKRYNPEEDKFYYQNFQVPLFSPTTALNILRYIYLNYDHSLSFNEGCGEGKCGCCLIKINGQPRLACNYIVTGSNQTLNLSPLDDRDLVVDFITR